MINNINNISKENLSPSTNPVVVDFHKKAEVIKVQETTRSAKQEQYSSDQERNKLKATLEQVFPKINDELQEKNLKLAYFQDKVSGKIVIQLKDVKSEEVIRQIPNKEMLAVANNIKDFLDSYDNKGNQAKIVRFLPFLNTTA